uniref:Reverse transcriptase domain-containing protein n=1 Tax=Latimeria chalumnae TaxID=7897 RepID=H3A710_LATCH
WLIHTLWIYKVNEKVIALLSMLMQTWCTHLHVNVGGQLYQTQSVCIERGIFQGDSLSPLWFYLALNPLSKMFRNSGYGYSLGRRPTVLVSHLFYMDDLKLYTKNSDQLQSMLELVSSFSKSIVMELGVEKCTILHAKRGKLERHDNIQLLDGGQIRHLEEGEAYKYLGVLELDNIQHKKMKEKIKAEYNRRARKILKSKLSGENMTRAINHYAVPVIGYTTGTVDWTREEMQELDRKTRKHGMVHPRADINRLYVKRKEGGRGLRSIEDMIDIKKLALRDYVNSRTDGIVRSGGEQEREITTAERCQEYKRNKKNSRYNSWKQKMLHGQYIQQLGGETEAFLIAAQDQALNTNFHRVRILHSGTESKYTMCKAKEEAVAHIILGCKMLANGSYKERHNNIARSIHWALCKKANIEVTNQWWNHQPKTVEETTIRTEREVQVHKPDLVFVDKTNKKAKIIDIACPIDYNIGEKEQEKIMKYQMEIEKLWKVRVEVIPVVIGALGEMMKKHEDYIKKIEDLQKAALHGTIRIVRNVL